MPASRIVKLAPALLTASALIIAVTGCSSSGSGGSTTPAAAAPASAASGSSSTSAATTSGTTAATASGSAAKCTDLTDSAATTAVGKATTVTLDSAGGLAGLTICKVMVDGEVYPIQLDVNTNGAADAYDADKQAFSGVDLAGLGDKAFTGDVGVETLSGNADIKVVGPAGPVLNNDYTIPTAIAKAMIAAEGH